MREMGQVTKKTIDIDQILKNKMGNGAKWVPGFLVSWLKRIAHQDQVNEFLWESSDKVGTPWLEACVEYLQMTLNIEGLEHLPSKKISVSFHEIKVSFLEAVFARGDRRLADVLELAWKRGCKFDGWGEFFKYDTWMECFRDLGLQPEFYANRQRDYSEILPWEHLNYGISKAYLKKESEKARRAETTPNCQQKCAGCGASKLNGGHCDV